MKINWIVWLLGFASFTRALPPLSIFSLQTCSCSDSTAGSSPAAVIPGPNTGPLSFPVPTTPSPSSTRSASSSSTPSASLLFSLSFATSSYTFPSTTTTNSLQVTVSSSKSSSTPTLTLYRFRLSLQSPSPLIGSWEGSTLLTEIGSFSLARGFGRTIFARYTLDGQWGYFNNSMLHWFSPPKISDVSPYSLNVDHYDEDFSVQQAVIDDWPGTPGLGLDNHNRLVVLSSSTVGALWYSWLGKWCFC
jgi:hypothetical protein